MTGVAGAGKRVAVVDDLDWPLRRHYDVLEGIQTYAEEHGWELDVGPYPEARMRRGVRYDGIVGRIEESTWEGAVAAGIPVVNTWMHSPVRGQVPGVGVDFYEGSKMAAQHLVARGLSRLLYAGIAERLHAEAQFEGVREVANANGLTCTQKAVDGLHDPDNRDRWEQTNDELTAFFKDVERPVGVVAMSDLVARSLVPIIQDAGLRIPEDLAIVATGDDPMASSNLHPTLTSIDMGYHQVGYQAAGLLARGMAGEQLPREIVRVPPKALIVRHSSDSFAVRDPQVATALAYMRENCHCLIGVADVVKQVELSRNLLERRFREYTGRTINQELIRMRVERLKRLLVESDKSVNALHADAGFGTPSNMYLTFRKVVGVTPAEYRAARRS